MKSGIVCFTSTSFLMHSNGSVGAVWIDILGRVCSITFPELKQKYTVTNLDFEQMEDKIEHNVLSFHKHLNVFLQVHNDTTKHCGQD